MSFEFCPRRFSKVSALAAIAIMIGALACTAWPAQSRVGVLQLDPAKTLVEFRLGGALHNIHGKFQLKSGTIEADSDSGKAEGAIIVDAASGDSGDSMRDNRMRDSVLEAAQFPEITFTPRHIDGQLGPGGSFHATMEGVLKVHGADHVIRIDTQGTIIDDNLIATAHFSVPYVKWGLKDPSLLFLTVAKQVDIDIATAGRVTWLTL